MISQNRPNRTIFFIVLTAAILTSQALPADVLEQGRPLKIQNKVPQKAYAFTLRDVRLALPMKLRAEALPNTPHVPYFLERGSCPRILTSCERGESAPFFA